MRQNKWCENTLLNGLEKTDGAVFELIISGNWKTFFQFKLLENLPRYC